MIERMTGRNDTPRNGALPGSAGPGSGAPESGAPGSGRPESEAPERATVRGLPCVVARSMHDVHVAASFGRPLALLSARAAAAFAGCLAWQALARNAREAYPALIGADILDCADASGRALEALRLGQQILVLDGNSVGFADVRGRAEAIGAAVLPMRPHGFDPGLAARPSAGLRRALAAFLENPGIETGHDSAPP